MKVSIERGALLKAMSQAQSVVERRNTIPILANVLIEAEGSVVSFRATDLDIEVVDRAPAQVERAGATTVSAVTLHEIVRKLPDGALVNFVLFTDAAEVPDTTAVHSFGIDPWGRKRIVLAFNKPREGTGWKELGASELPEGTMPEGEWAEAVVLWDSGDRTVSLDLNGKRMADRTLDAGEELGHYFHLGVGSGNEIEVKELFAKLADEDK